jgi:hypothetical protein
VTRNPVTGTAGFVVAMVRVAHWTSQAAPARIQRACPIARTRSKSELNKDVVHLRA